MKDKHYSLEKIKVIQPKAVCHRYTAQTVDKYILLIVFYFVKKYCIINL